MKVNAKGVYLGLLSRKGKDGKVYNTVNMDFDGEIHSLSTSNPQLFEALPKYVECDFQLFFGSYRNKEGGTVSYMTVESARPLK